MNIFMWFSVSFNLFLSVLLVSGENKYSAEANNAAKMFAFETDINVKTLEKPFRMAKLNLLWKKAQIRLTEPKLKSLFSELKIHDKEEITWKRLKADGSDKEGLKEAELRKKLIGIMSTYGLLDHFQDVNDKEQYKHHNPYSGPVDKSHLNKSLFKDKKLNKLWAKAETSGFTSVELQALKEEFNHHQDKVDQYYALLEDVGDRSADDHKNSIDDKLDRFNTIGALEEEPDKNFISKANELRDRHKEIRDSFDRLHHIAVKGPNSEEFVEPKVQGLWRLATNTNFTKDELESLRVELLHYEKRLLKLRHLQVEAAIVAEQKQKKSGEKVRISDMMDENIKKQARKAEKLHLDLEGRIMQKHVEL